ncbi:MAG TPA: DUF1553 domain-containing protein [Armatimonadota bacterium]
MSHAQAPPVRPYESDVAPAASQIDAAVQVHLRQKGLLPANPCSDEVFLRRVYVDVIGTLPTPTEVTGFLADTRPNKRAAVIDALLQRDEFADYWALKWCDLLRVKSEFPINLWPNAVQAYHRWVREAIRRNEPLDQFARELLTTSGSNFRDPPVNFYRAVQGRDPASLAAAVALTFMGTRLDTWAPAQRANLAVFFSRVAYKKTDEWKEEIVYLNPAPAGPLSATLPDGKTVQIPPDKDPREVFADWLLAPGNPWFARSLANRAWYWFLGRGIVQEPDDIRPDNPPANPELLALLAQDLQDSHYDLRQLFRVILNSRTYQQSCLPRSDQPEAATLFAYYPVRRLDAEVLIDALCWIGGDGETYSSAIPEPYTFLPPSQRTISLADGSITSEFLETFGRPARDTGRELERNNQPTDAQRLYLLNSADVQRRIERSPRLAAMLSAAQGNRAQIISGAYLTVLSRYPTPAEAAAADAYFQTGKEQPQQALADLAWALVNTKEFMYRH